MSDEINQLIQLLDAAHANLVKARKIAALSKHESYEEIGDAIECVEAAFVWTHKLPRGNSKQKSTSSPPPTEP